ncbi:MarR family winged helix-turn-helix transcriptional regulator [Dactylosporangium vinaceum]|uniref:MarR family winged helix-turn-helix transcriptional regulator n=1 Tax=Dactylosporangium vinaceum TaxID=53362 RepID=A0ABV5MEG6_9ACTN|nr:MarR family transcriptional regulator [Dactylosporangium vinaceum]
MGEDDDRARAAAEFMRAGRESSRLSVLFRHALAARMGLTVTDMECLDFLMDTGSATAGRLAEQTNLTTGAVTSLIRRLEKAGFVSAERDPADRRRVIVTLLPARIDEGARLYAAFGAAVGEVIGSYTADELALLARHYDTMSAVYRTQMAALART